MTLSTVLLVILVLFLVGSLPTWPTANLGVCSKRHFRRTLGDPHCVVANGTSLNNGNGAAMKCDESGIKCDECGDEIVGELRQSFMVDGSFCSERCRDIAERIAA